MAVRLCVLGVMCSAMSVARPAPTVPVAQRGHIEQYQERILAHVILGIMKQMLLRARHVLSSVTSVARLVLTVPAALQIVIEHCQGPILVRVTVDFIVMGPRPVSPARLWTDASNARRGRPVLIAGPTTRSTTEEPAAVLRGSTIRPRTPVRPVRRPAKTAMCWPRIARVAYRA